MGVEVRVLSVALFLSACERSPIGRRHLIQIQVSVSSNLTARTLLLVSADTELPFPKRFVPVRLWARRPRPHMHLVKQLRCLRSEAGSIPTEGAIRRSAGHNGASKTPEESSILSRRAVSGSLWFGYLLIRERPRFESERCPKGWCSSMAER